MDRLIKGDEKTSVSNIICVSYIRSYKETCMLCKSSASNFSDAMYNIVFFAIKCLDQCYRYFWSNLTQLLL